MIVFYEIKTKLSGIFKVKRKRKNFNERKGGKQNLSEIAEMRTFK